MTADFVKKVAIVLGLVALALVLHAGRSVLLLFFAGVLLAIFLRAPANAVAKRVPWLGRTAAFAISALLVASLVIGFVALAGPRLGEQARELSEQIPRGLDAPLERLRELPGGSWIIEQAQGLERDPGSGSGLLSRVTGMASSVFGLLTEMIVVVFVGLFLGADPRLYRQGALHLVPQRHRERARELLDDIGETLRWWLVGRISSMAIILVATYLALLALGLPLALILAVLAGVLTFIPNFGPVLAALPAILLGLADSPRKALLVAGAYLAIQAIESYVLTPLIQQRAVSLPPALILLSQVFFGLLFGFWGLVLATPMTATLLVLVRRLYVEDALGDTSFRDDD